MPDPVKSLTDFYDPTRTMQVGLQYMQGQQMLAGQQQARDQQGRNMQIDNLRQAALTAIQENPMAAPGLYNQYMEQVGGEQIKDPAAFIANTKPFYEQLKYAPGSSEHQGATAAISQMGASTQKRSREEFERELLQEGNTQLSVASGGSSDPAAGFALSKSDAGQRAAYGREFDPAKQAQLVANQEHLDQVAGIKSELGPLISLGLKASTAMEELGPITAQIAPIQARYDKEVKTLGITAAAGARRELVLTNPDLAQYVDRAKASIPTLEKELAEVKTMRLKTLEQAQHIAAGTRPRTENDNLRVMVGETKAQALHQQYLQAQLALAKDPLNPAKHASVAQIVQTMDARAGELHQQQTSLSARQDALREAAREHELTRERVALIDKAQNEFAQLPDVSQTQQSAGKIGAKYGVGSEEVYKGIKNPNKAGIEIKMPGTTEEAGKFSMIDNAVKNIDAVTEAITKPDGSIDRQKVFTAALNVPFTEGRELNSMMEDAISAKLRAETGAAANAEEVRSISRRFNLSTLDKDDVIKSKLSRLRRFLNETRVIRDSTGKIRESAAKGEAAQEQPKATGGTLSPQEQQELDTLRKRYGR